MDENSFMDSRCTYKVKNLNTNAKHGDFQVHTLGNATLIIIYCVQCQVDILWKLCISIISIICLLYLTFNLIIGSLDLSASIKYGDPLQSFISE